MDKIQYKKAIKACALDKDIESCFSWRHDIDWGARIEYEWRVEIKDSVG